MKRIVVGISGATGAIYGIRLLQELRSAPEVEIHLVISAPGKRTIAEETDFKVKDVESLAHHVYDNRDIGAALASGSFKTAGMAVVPCSIKTVSAVAHSYTETLIARAADVALKERRPLVMAVRESPLHAGHLRQLSTLAELGAVILPPLPAFYLRPRSIEDMVNHTVGRILDHLGLPNALFPEWNGTGATP
jgi:4-hydroxy-3-polyprenylbenzoate decarboxylase